MVFDYFSPSEIVIDANLENTKALDDWLTSKKGKKVKILRPLKGDKKKMLNLCIKNSDMIIKDIMYVYWRGVKLFQPSREKRPPHYCSVKKDQPLTDIKRHYFLKFDPFDMIFFLKIIYFSWRIRLWQ